jgi:hypothetical protein
MDGRSDMKDSSTEKQPANSLSAHQTAIRQKLGADGALQLILIAQQFGLVAGT